MALSGRDRSRIGLSQEQAMAHPARERIMELFERDRLRSLKADVLSADLLSAFPGLNPHDLRLPQVAYHVAVLRDAELLPTG